MTRERELESALGALSDRLANACRGAGRDPGEVTLLPVTKYFPARDVAILYELGCREFGESREQEATAKIAELAELSLPIRWHMIGRLQRNKVRAVARWAHTVQSVDSIRLVDALDHAVAGAMEAGERTERLSALVQVSLDDDPTRGGVSEADLLAVAERVAAAEGLVLSGVMAVAPLDVEPERAFARLVQVHERLLREYPTATVRSAGMSADLESAVAYGSTCVRVGTALMGARPIPSP